MLSDWLLIYYFLIHCSNPKVNCSLFNMQGGYSTQHFQGDWGRQVFLKKHCKFIMLVCIGDAFCSPSHVLIINIKLDVISFFILSVNLRINFASNFLCLLCLQQNMRAVLKGMPGSVMTLKFTISTNLHIYLLKYFISLLICLQRS